MTSWPSILFRSRFLSETRGAAAAEMALWLTVIAIPAISVVDVGAYIFTRMQLETAATAAVSAARAACGFEGTPATSSSACNQTTLMNAIRAGAQSTTLGSNVTVASGYPHEQYYCGDSSTGALVAVGSVGTSGSPPAGPTPFDCSTVIAGSAAAPGDYLIVKVDYAYSAIFPGISLASGLATPITRTAWLRLR